MISPSSARSVRDLAWAAGLFEGEGCISVRSPRGFVLALNMTDDDVVDRFLTIVRVGGIYGPYMSAARLSSGRKPLYQWQCGAQPDCAALLMTLYPFLGERRREKAEEALAVWRARPFYRGSHPEPGWDQRLPLGLPR